MKTTEQIAAETIALNYGDDEGLTQALAQGDVDTDGIRAMIEGAIEADRAQRMDVPPTLLEQVGADFQDGNGFWYLAEPTGEWTDVVIYHEESERLARYAYEHATDTVTTYFYSREEAVR